jgi:hypothetical protein
MIRFTDATPAKPKEAEKKPSAEDAKKDAPPPPEAVASDEGKRAPKRKKGASG